MRRAIWNFDRRMLTFVLGVLVCFLNESTTQAGTITTKGRGSTPRLHVTFNPEPEPLGRCNAMDIVIEIQGGPSPADRNLEFVLYIGGYGLPSVAYRTEIILRQGSTQAEARLIYVQTFANSGVKWHIDVLEDGRSLIDSNATSNFRGHNYSGNTTAVNCCEIVNRTAGNLDFPYDFALDGVNAIEFDVPHAPDDWRMYLNYNFVVCPIEQLAQFSESQREALSTFVLSGGTIMFYYATVDELPKIDRFLAGAEDEVSPDPRWKPLILDPLGIRQDSESSGDDNPTVRARPHGGGQIIALANLEQSLSLHAYVKTSTHYPIGNVIPIGSADTNWFWSNLIRSVGKTPVWAFTSFVLLFLLVVGPGLLYFTARLRQRTLMLFLVPGLSALITSFILVYNISREGFLTRGRIASLQYFDAPLGQGFAWSRQTYFSGAPPREGLQFSADSVLKLVDLSEGGGWNDAKASSIGDIVKQDQSQQLRNWLTARSQQQVLVGHKLERFTLPIQVAASTEGRLKLTNSSKSMLPIVILRGPGDEFYWLSELQPGETREVDPQSLSGVQVAYTKESQTWIPQIPPEVALSVVPHPRYGSYASRIPIDPLDGALKSRNLIEELPDYGFLIFATQSPDIEMPFAEDVYQQEQHFHVLRGVSAAW